MPQAKKPKAPHAEHETLITAASSTFDLLQQFRVLFHPYIVEPPENPIANPPNSLDVLYTAATLLKAQTTKLSLLILNKPFTPTAIRKVIADITISCLPAMMSAVQLCRPEKYGQVMHLAAKARVFQVFTELQNMMKEIIDQARSHTQRRGSTSSTGSFGPMSSRDSLASTGIVWEACDSIMALQRIGLHGLLVEKAREYREQLEDAIEELKDFRDGAEITNQEEEEQVEGSDDENESHDSFDVPTKLPADRDDIKAVLAVSIKQLILISTLYQALLKRRLKNFPYKIASNRPEDEAARQAFRIQDSLMGMLQWIPEATDELAGAIYELDFEDSRQSLEHVCQSARDAIRLVANNWNGEEDEFTVWQRKWLEWSETFANELASQSMWSQVANEVL